MPLGPSDSPARDGRVDVAVVGGGPAGAAAALSLARAGRKVALLERSRYDSARVGETLAPSALPLLGALGVCDQFLARPHVPAYGLVSVWDDAVPYEQDFIWNPYGHGWQLDRCRFDAMLSEAAADAGAEVYVDARLWRCQRDGATGWRLEALTGGGRLRLAADFLIEATGRRPPPVAHALSRKLIYDRLVGAVALLEPHHATEPDDARTWVEAAEDGWWYSAPLPGGQLAVAYMTDHATLKTGGAATAEGWQSLLRQSAYTWARAREYPVALTPRVVSAGTYRRERVVGADHLVVGDAAAAYDPLAGQGIVKALEAGIIAARAAAARLEQGPAALEAYERWVEAGFTQYLGARTAYYRRVRRWQGSRFWRSRQVEPVPVPIDASPATAGGLWPSVAGQ